MGDHKQRFGRSSWRLTPVLDERLTRLWAGAEADALGDVGIAIVGRATALSRTTIHAGRDELLTDVLAPASHARGRLPRRHSSRKRQNCYGGVASRIL
jgi:hypothetical protein